MGRSIRAQMKAADRMRRADYILVLGDMEVQEGQGKLRRLSDGSESEVALAALATLLARE